MPDPNNILGQILMVCDDVAKSKTALGYDQNLLTKLGMIVFGNADTLRGAIQALDIARSGLLRIEQAAESTRASITRALERHGDRK